MKNLLEFFSGVGMVRAGFGPDWQVVFANDISPEKKASYIANFGHGHFHCCDVAEIKVSDLPPGRADCAWLSPPCVGHSEAGDKKGFDEEQSRAFWPCWALVEQLNVQGRAPLAIIFENVSGIKPENLRAVQAAIARAGYKISTRIVDARHWVPQQRERVIVVGAHEDLGVDPEPLFEQAMGELPRRSVELVDVLDLDRAPGRCLWEYSPAEVARYLAMLSPLQRERLAAIQASGRPFAGPFSRRMRDVLGSTNRVQRIEIKFDGLASALRVPGGRVNGKAKGGGSSKQFLLIVTPDAKIRMRGIQPREAARLMGLPDSFVLPTNALQALALCGDGVVVPVVRFLVERVIEPLLHTGARPDEAQLQRGL
jgi:DNA (cytosine-5)-methyltransferase 1